MEINYQKMADRVVAYAKENGNHLDFSEGSVEQVDLMLGWYHERLAEYEGEDGGKTLWNLAVHFGVYLGETLLRLGLEEKGYAWYIEDGIPILKNGEKGSVSPITKAHKRILYGSEDNVKTFCDVVFSVVNGSIPANNVLRAVDAEFASGKREENVLYRDIDHYILCVENGEEDFLILSSHDGFLQFYGADDQFVAETRVNLPNGDFRTYSIIDEKKEHLTDRVRLMTPFGEYTPTAREVVSLDLIREVVREYYENADADEFLKRIPCIDTTEETKRYMGLIK